MGLRARMNAAFISLFMLFLVGFMAIGLILGLPWFIPVILASFFILLQYLISPYIVKLVYKIDWIGVDKLEPEIRRYVVSVCRANGVEVPKYGVIHDDNPNAFCFGWTRNRSFLVLTDGIDKYCTLKEKKAVIGHELGHIIHNDFIVMTIICMVPLLFYIIGKSCLESMKYSRGNNKGGGIIVLIGLISLLIYIISEFIVLLVSRYREYWADGYSARSTKDPNSLSSALIKIAYGLASEGKGDTRMKQIKYENALMISDPRSGRSLAFNSQALSGKVGFTREDIKEAMAWDIWNPWAKWLELKSSHPLPAKRIMVLDKISTDMGKKPYVNFDLKQPESYWDDFIQDISAAYGWIFALPMALAAIVIMVTIVPPSIAFIAGLGVLMSIIGLSLFMYLDGYRYPMDFRRASLEFCLDDPKANPKRGIPVEVEGTVIGRGSPGLFFNEDLKLDDGTALMLIDYHQVMRLLNLFEGIFRTKGRVGKTVRIRGWYRRMVVPYIELYDIEWEGGYKKMRTRGVYTVLCLILGIAGIVLQLIMPLALLFTLAFLLVFFLFIRTMRNKNIDDWENRADAREHPYEHIGSITASLLRYKMLDYCEEVPGDLVPMDHFEGEPVLMKNKVECPSCGSVQTFLVGDPRQKHKCGICGLKTQIDMPRVRM